MTETHTLWTYLLPGITFGFAAAVQPGPLMMYLISRSLQAGWRRTLPGVLAPLVSDGPIAVICLFALGSLPGNFVRYLQIPGGLFIIYLAYQAIRAWKKGNVLFKVSTGSSRRSLFDATLVNFLNPGPWLGWTLVIGPLFVEGWKESPVNGVALLAGFYLTMFFFTGLVVVLFHQARGRGPKLQRILTGLSAVFLGAFGVYQLVSGVWGGGL